MAKETRVTVRIPTDLHKWLQGNAKTNRRSVNSQVIEILDTYRLNTEAISLEKPPESKNK